MAATSGALHGLSAFVTIIVGAMLSKYVWQIAPPLGELSLLLIRIIEPLTGAAIPVNRQFAGMVLVMAVLSFVWGIAYHLKRPA
jgi:uncharacterized membrane protein YoaK (UPF0700 family)